MTTLINVGKSLLLGVVCLWGIWEFTRNMGGEE